MRTSQLLQGSSARLRHICLLLSVLCCGCLASQQIVQPLPSSSYQSIDDNQPRAYIFPDDEWFNWGASIIKDEDGKYHMFYSRWPRKYNFTSWLTHSEIAHAVSDKPEGPYKYLDTAISCKGDSEWDKFTAHNPKIKKFDGKYYLYYIGTYADLTEEELIETAKTGYSHKNWKPLRENQRTGVAVADRLAGPWKRSKKPIIEPAGPITTLTVNPAITQGPDGTYFMIIKGDKPGTTKFVRNQALATSKNPDGPFTIHPKPVIDTFDTEDASMWS
ncbi:MAG: glycoside hydrolase family protein, partial [Anaerohalosphaera sp.]|nr:glycoside hydrolase family protein [Anaerohalosphaera sp.]